MILLLIPHFLFCLILLCEKVRIRWKCRCMQLPHRFFIHTHFFYNFYRTHNVIKNRHTQKFFYIIPKHNVAEDLKNSKSSSLFYAIWDQRGVMLFVIRGEKDSFNWINKFFSHLHSLLFSVRFSICIWCYC